MNLLIIPIIVGIIAFFVMRNEKSTLPEGQIDESPLIGNKFWYVFILCLLSPLIAQTIFYYGWKKRLPKKAKQANNLGWLAFLIWMGGNIAINILLR
jgi:hypothetical protein